MRTPNPVPAAVLAADRGFTIIELLIVMLLLAGVLALGSQALVGGFSSSSRSQARQSAETMANNAVEELGADLRQARAADRVIHKVRDLDRFRRVILTGGELYGPCTDDWRLRRQCQLDIYDVSIATPTRLRFEADVVSEPRGQDPVVECVTWRLRRGGGTWSVHRDVHRYRWRCQNLPDSSLLATRAVVPTVSSADTGIAAPQRIFSYRLQRNPRVRAMGSIDPGDCRIEQLRRRAATELERNWIVAVTMQVDSHLYRSDTSGRQRLDSGISIRARQAHDYLYATGCAA